MNGIAGIEKKGPSMSSRFDVHSKYILGLEIHLFLIVALQMLKPHFYINFES